MNHVLPPMLQSLVDLAGPPLGVPLVTAEHLLQEGFRDAEELENLLRACNGFEAFDGALLLRPWNADQSPLGMREWNAATVWGEFGAAAPRCWMFGADIFGCQFALTYEGVVRYDPECGTMESVAHSLEGWAEWILRNPDETTGRAILREWTTRNGRVPPGHRLMAKQLFVLGGGFTIDNLVVKEERMQMQILAPIARQIHDLPDGSDVVLRVEDHLA